MSAQIAPEQVCYVNCNYCSTILAVNVPCNCSFNIVTVRCGHCAMVLSMDLGPLHLSRIAQDQQVQNKGSGGSLGDHVAIPRNQRSAVMHAMPNTQQQLLPIRQPEKRQRVPSAYNRFIKEEIQRIKASNPEISHREAFSAAAKNWAHLPRLHFGLSLDGANKVDAAPAMQKVHGGVKFN